MPEQDKFHWGATAVLVMIVAWFAVLKPRGEPERWFVPGPLGHEAGVWASGGRIPNSEGVVARNTRELASGARSPASKSSRFITRVFSGGSNSEARAWERRNGRTEPVAFSHNLARVFPAGLYGQHPEFFPLVHGARLAPQMNPVNWNPDLGRPDVAAHAARVARDYFTAHPEASSFSLSVNDGLIFGESPELRALVDASADGGRTPEAGRQMAEGEGQGPEVGKLASGVRPLASGPKWFRSRPDYSDLVFTFMNRAAADLARTHPDRYLGALAYYWAENAPDFAVDPQVLPFLTADRSQGYDPAFQQEEFALQERWVRALGIAPQAGGRTPEAGNQRSEVSFAGFSSQPSNRGQVEVEGRAASGIRPLASGLWPQPPPRLGLYDYLDGSGFLIPRIHPRLIAENIRHAWQAGFTDYYGEGEPNWGLDGPMHWLVARMLEDPEQAPDKLLDEYYRRYFREAAAPMRRFFERCEEQWMHQAGPAYWLKHYRNESQAAIFPGAVCAELRGYLEEAKARSQTPGARHSEVLAARVQLVSDAFGVTERFVAFQESRDALNRLALAQPGRGARSGAGDPIREDRRPGSGGRPADLTAALGKFLNAREEFLNCLQALPARQPLALAPFGLQDYTSHDPVMNALVAFKREDGGLETGGPTPVARETETASVSRLLHDQAGHPELERLWRSLNETPVWREVCRNGELQGALVPARVIAGLEYGVALPAEWVSKVEPAEWHRAVFIERPAAAGQPDAGSQRPKNGRQISDVSTRSSGLRSPTGRALRISGTADTAIFQWSAVEAGAWYLSHVNMLGRVGPGCAATLTFGWLDAQQRNLGYTTMRLPEGDWPDPLVLSQGGYPPAGAAYVGVGVRIQHQTGDDWVEVSDFSLKVAPATP